MASPELIEAPLSRDALAARYAEICADPRYADLPGKLEIDVWGRLLLSPGNNLHSLLQARLARQLSALGGEAFVEAVILTQLGVTVADVAWASADFMRAHGTQTPFPHAPELCVEVASPSNSRKDLIEKTEAYLAAGAEEAWIVLPSTKRIERYGVSGALSHSAFDLDLRALFK